ncbi:hypothetical protein [Alteromonas halophila]|uniref:Phytase-like domain-containing protein n=1 Tax=Alteromonas halophila TaxID=516698 RepID=A0A918JQ15_9ALTE|nr:hypothetical protein [Alteromonas halophila]GGW91904.1 hypothetical protein GCM10007391_27690 [Alteromonas halophila]
MNYKSGITLLMLVLTGCSEPQPAAPENIEQASSVLTATGQWVQTAGKEVMSDPQTSGLTVVDGKLVTVSDGSADAAQQRKLHVIDPATATLGVEQRSFSMASRVRRSCFYQYLSDAPDLEALVVDPNDSDVFYTVTEDATRTGALSVKCQRRYKDTGSTDYPTLLVRLERMNNDRMMMTHVRPVQFALRDDVGDFPNDGIEGMALSDNNTLYLGLEKDSQGQPRIFSVIMDEAFWETDEFARVIDSQLSLPVFTRGNHPINGLTWYRHPQSQVAYLLAAARNDNELWVVRADGEGTTLRVPMQFTAPTDGASADCSESHEVMDNASIEGVAIIDSTLWLINDPWKKNYLKNVQCEALRPHYEAMAPLIFSVPLQDEWFSIEAENPAS